MRKQLALLFILAVPMILFASGKSEDMVQNTPSGYILELSSFDGGGPEYDLVIEDPSLVSVSSRQQYSRADHNEIDGAAYSVLFTIIGQKPGTSTMVVQARSPIAENQDIPYTITVDEDLNVTLVRLNTIEYLLVQRSFADEYGFHEIRTFGPKWILETESGNQTELGLKTVLGLVDALSDLEISSWENLETDHELECKILEGAVEGEFYYIDVVFDDGTGFTAEGCYAPDSESGPKNYMQFIGLLEGLPTFGE